ncbi:efflux RND transporter permease subunit [bacterium]|jgi:multidrug efflux pump subunit AcrB|nr:efflux RND transporter permease subunit [bacterium]
MLNSIVRFFINRPKVVNLVLVFILLSGSISMMNTQNSGYPTVDFGAINITTVYPGASPEDVEIKVTSKIEEQLKTVSGIDLINSASLENLSQISILMEEKADYEKVEADIQKAVDQIDDFPNEIQTSPLVKAVDSDRIPVMEIAITGDAPYHVRRQYALTLEKLFRAEPLVGSIYNVGYLKQEVKIEANQKRLDKHYLSLNDLVVAIQNHNIRIPGGDLKVPNNEKKIVVMSEFEEPYDVGDVIIRSGFEGNSVRIKDVASVINGFEPADQLVSLNGDKAIKILLQKKPKADVLKTSAACKEILKTFKEKLPEGVNAELIVDYSVESKNLLDMVKKNALVGLVLVLIMLILFFNIKVAFWTAMGIPVSILMAFLILPKMGGTINFITMMGIIIVLGMLVDDAIVVAENIFRYREKGLSGKDAAIQGTKEVMLPVIATVLTTIVAFSPLMAMTGVMGKFMFYMPVVVSLILLASLIESLFLLPSHMAHIKLKPAKERKFRPFKALEKYYKAGVLWTLRNKFVTLFLFIGMFAFSIWLLVTQMTFILFDSSDGLYGIIKYESSRGTSLEETAKKAKQFETILDNHRNGEIYSYVTTSGEKGPVIASFGPQLNHSGVGNILIHLTPISSRNRNAKTIMDEIREKALLVPGFKKIEIDVVQDGPPVGRAITASLVSNNDPLREKFLSELVAFIKELPGAQNVTTNEGEGKQQLEIRFNYGLMARLGVNPIIAAQTVRTAFDGNLVTSIRYNGEDLDYRVSLSKNHKSKISTLKEITVPSKSGKLIPLGQLITTEITDNILMINHYDGDRSVTVYGDLDTEVNTSRKVTQAIQKEFSERIDEDPTIRLIFGGEEKDTQEAMQSLFQALLLALLGIYFILVILFNSFLQPFLVMSSIPFTFTGIVFAFYMHSMTFGFVALIGLIGLMGIVVNNALIMIMFMNYSKKDDEVTMDGLADSATKRLRPICLTTLTTAAGLFPTAYGFGGDNAFLVPMIMAIAWGLIFASVITLFLVPALYLIQYRGLVKWENFKKRFSK